MSSASHKDNGALAAMEDGVIRSGERVVNVTGVSTGMLECLAKVAESAIGVAGVITLVRCGEEEYRRMMAIVAALSRLSSARQPGICGQVHGERRQPSCLRSMLIVSRRDSTTF